MKQNESLWNDKTMFKVARLLVKEDCFYYNSGSQFSVIPFKDIYRVFLVDKTLSIAFNEEQAVAFRSSGKQTIQIALRKTTGLVECLMNAGFRDMGTAVLELKPGGGH